MAKREQGHITEIMHEFKDGSIHTDEEFMNHLDELSDQAFKIPAFVEGIRRIYSKQFNDEDTNKEK